MTTDMGRQVDPDNRAEVAALFGDQIMDSTQVAKMVGLASRNSVYVYLGRPQMRFPKPIYSSGRFCKLWFRPDILNWLESRRTQ
jgi:predicted DNA-binding transcriptional regulator AlpA